MLDTKELLLNFEFSPINRNKLDSLQLNLGYMCNQQCLHCHVNAGPNRTEKMSKLVIENIKTYSLNNNIKKIDLTGGAPEMHSEFKNIIQWASDNNIKVIDRCNLSILLEPDQTGLIDFLAVNKVEIVASMPCYLAENVDRQRGKGVFDKSIIALQKLNESGYGLDPDLTLNLVFNPQGASLPPNQSELELDYKKYLFKEYGIKFNNLLVITNLPIARFGSSLLSKGEFHNYMELLQQSFNPGNLNSLMCKNILSIDWEGFIYDCDFNQMLKLPSKNMNKNKNKTNIKDLIEGEVLSSEIATMGHCFGCTAGQGSSCSGALLSN